MNTANLILAVFASAGLAVVALNTPAQHVRLRLNAGLWALLGAWILGRAGYVLAAWPYYQEHLAEIPAMFQGGMSAPGALVGGMLFACLAAALSRTPGAQICDSLAPLAACMAAGGWLAAWMFGAAYAPPGPSALLSLPARDEWGNWQARAVLPVFGAVASLSALFIVDAARSGWLRLRALPLPQKTNRQPQPYPWPGWSGSLVLVLLSLFNFSFSFLRADPARVWEGLRLDAWGWLGCAALAAVAWITFFVQRGKHKYEGKYLTRTDQHPLG